MLPQFGWNTPEDALDKTFSAIGRNMQVIGVLEDFNYQSLHSEIRPLAMVIQPTASQFLSLRLNADNAGQTRAQLEEIWKELAPHRPFEAYMMEDLQAEQYDTEAVFVTIFRFASGFAIIIACLGLFGLTAFTAQQRTKEIGVRKVLGASITQILAMLSKDFFKLLLLAYVLAIPLGYFAADSWLSDFAYRSTLDPWIFILSGLIAFIVAGLTVSYQSLKAASINPVKAIRQS
jgi:putative ABC transport system permease protein